jgi:hypothetical protein
MDDLDDSHDFHARVGAEAEAEVFRPSKKCWLLAIHLIIIIIFNFILPTNHIMARGVTTEWEDIQVKKGNWKPREYVPTSEDVFYAQQENVESYDNWKDLNAKQLEEMVEDDYDLDDDEYMKEYRAKRMEQLKEASETHKFHGGIIEISKDRYEWHVQNMPKETLGVILMYQD